MAERCVIVKEIKDSHAVERRDSQFYACHHKRLPQMSDSLPTLKKIAKLRD